MAFQRFTYQRFTPEDTHYDNGTNFVGCKRNQRIGSRTSLRKRECTFILILQQPAIREECVKTLIGFVRKSLMAITNGCVRDDKKFSTFLAEIERILNDCEVTPVLSKSRGFGALTPASLLEGTLDATIPLGIFCKADGC